MNNPLKQYAIIHLNFWKKTYFVIYYSNRRIYTSRQAWQRVRGNLSDFDKVISGPLGDRETIMYANELAKKLELDEKRCNFLYTFSPIR